MIRRQSFLLSLAAGLLFVFMFTDPAVTLAKSSRLDARMSFVHQTVDELRTRMGVRIPITLQPGDFPEIKNLMVMAYREKDNPSILLLFDVDFLDKARDESIQGVVAHELAHLKLNHKDTEDLPLSARIRREEDTDRVASDFVGVSVMVGALRDVVGMLRQNRTIVMQTIDIYQDRIRALEKGKGSH